MSRESVPVRDPVGGAAVHRWIWTLALLSLGVLFSTRLTLARATSFVQQSASLVAVRLRNDGSPEPTGADCGDAPCIWDLRLGCDGRIDYMSGEMGRENFVHIALVPANAQ
ncbi:hypothetical protein L6R53_09975 [Myxococcota bacterium]|nr:hypothetical protein [Myxococcota bacterium]